MLLSLLNFVLFLIYIRKSRSLEDFEELGDSRENINSSAPDLRSPDDDDEDDDDEPNE